MGNDVQNHTEAEVWVDAVLFPKRLKQQLVLSYIDQVSYILTQHLLEEITSISLNSVQLFTREKYTKTRPQT